MDEQTFKVAGSVAIWLVFLLALRRRGMAPVLVLAVCGHLAYFSVNLGFVLEPAKAIGLTLLAIFAFRPGAARQLASKYAAPFLLFYLYLVLITMLNMPLWSEGAADVQGFFYSKWMRGPVQLFQVLLGLCIVVLIMRSVKSIEDIDKILRATVFAMAALCVYGLYVWFAQQYGLPYNSITRQGGLGGHEAGTVISAMIGGERVARAYSLSGEPKALASNAVLLITLIFFTARSRTLFLKQMAFSLTAIGLGLLTIYLTYSTAGFITLILVFIAVLAISSHLPSHRKHLRLQIPLVLAFGLVFFFLFGDEYLPKIVEALDNRLVDRLDDQGLFTFADASMIAYFSTTPPHAIFGVGLGGSTFYVREFDPYSYAGYVAAPRGLIGFVADKGIAGLAIYFYAIANCLVAIIRRARVKDRVASLYANVAVFVVMALILQLTFTTWYMEWFTLGLVIAAARLAHDDLRFLMVSNSYRSRGRVEPRIVSCK